MATVGQIWPIGTDCMIVLSGLKDDNNNYVNNATIVGNLVDQNNNPVTNGSAIAFTYVAASNGQYQGLMPYNVDVSNGQAYTLNLVVTASGKRALLMMQRNAANITI